MDNIFPLMRIEWSCLHIGEPSIALVCPFRMQMERFITVEERYSPRGWRLRLLRQRQLLIAQIGPR